MSRYAAGDDAAFGQVYDLLAPRLYGYLKRASGEVATAEDLVQETFLKMHTFRGTFLDGAPVTPWAFAIARRLMIDRLRQQKRLPVAADVDLLGVLASDAGADEVAQAHGLAGRLETAFALLSPPQKEAFLLVRQDGLTHAEAAQVLGTTVTGIKLRLHRANETLRRALEEPAPAGKR